MASVTAAARRLCRHVARIRYRLLLINILVAAVPLVGISFADMYEVQLLAGLERDMVHQAQLVRAVVISEPTRSLGSYERVLRLAASDTRTRIRLLDGTGTVVADSHRGGPPEGAERGHPKLLRGQSPTHAAMSPEPLVIAERREVKAALAGRYGAATRLWGNQERVYLFSAVPLGPRGAVYVTRSTQDVKLQLYRLRTWLGRLLLATLAGTALISLVLATTIARPLARLTRRAESVAARKPIEPDDGLADRADEIGQLARAVDVMTRELERRARDARTLAADTSHELKNPLAGIRGAAELLRDGASEEPETRDRFLAMILDDAARLDRIVTRLFELARVEADHGIRLPVDLGALARTISRQAWPVPVEADASRAAIVNGRKGQLAAALENLVANATAFAAADTTVHIHVIGRRVTVTNRGPALSPAAQRKVWDRFYSTRTASGGTGLGLSIVRSVALAHGGAVGVHCADGETAFWIELTG